MIESFIQYKIGHTDLIVIGERHTHSKDKVIADIIKRYKKAIFLLEHPPNDDSTYQSSNMQLIKDNVPKKRIVGIDIRRKYIDVDLLYDVKYIKKLTIKRFLNIFWKENILNSLFNVNGEYNKKNLKFLKIYSQNKKNQIHNFSRRIPYFKLSDKMDKHHDIILFVYKMWRDVMDFHILKILLKNERQLYILLVGDSHAFNFYNIFKKFEIKN